jgi:predicted Zn-dependent peptidase
VTVLLAGDFNTDNAIALVKKYYGVLPRGSEAPLFRSQEPPQNAEKRVCVFAAVDQPAVYVGYHVPGLSDPDIPALQVLDALLSNGRSSRLQRSLVERQRVAGGLNPSGYDKVVQWRRDPSLLIYSISVPRAVDPERAANALVAEIETLRQQTVEDRDLRRAVRRLTTDQLSFILYPVWTMWSVDSQTEQAGFYEALTGDPEFVNKLIVAYEKVTPSDIQRVARKYLDESNRTIVFLLPRAAEKN